MRKTLLLLLFPMIALSVGCRTEEAAQGAATPAPVATPTTSAEYGAGTATGDAGPGFDVQVVSVDAAGRNITVREVATAANAPTGSTATAPQRQLPVAAEAVEMLASIRPGDRVMVHCAATQPGAAEPQGSTFSNCTRVTVIMREGGAASR
jgi:hypothetical protein